MGEGERVRVAALYVDPKGPYCGMPGVDAWPAARDARLYPGPWPVVAHPPCGPWGRFRGLCTKQDPELARIAVSQVRRWGGVLEHPAHSRLWGDQGLPLPGDLTFPDWWSLEVEQVRWGHRARKRTWLLCSRIPRTAIGLLPPPATASHVVASTRRHVPGARPSLGSRTTHITPPAFAAWLVDLAQAAGQASPLQRRDTSRGPGCDVSPRSRRDTSAPACRDVSRAAAPDGCKGES